MVSPCCSRRYTYDATATPAWRITYADAATRPQATPAPSTPVALLSPLQGTPSLRPRTSLRPLALPAWKPTWDNDSDVGGTKETKDDDPLVVDVTTVAELISQAESAIDRKYEEISAIHFASKSTISSALAAVDDAIRTATAPDGLLDRRIGESIASAVDPDGLLQRIGESIASAISSAVASTMDENFVSYRTCVLDEQHAAEVDLHAARKSAETDFQDAIATITSDSIDTLNAALRSAAAEFAAKRDSVVTMPNRTRLTPLRCRDGAQSTPPR